VAGSAIRIVSSVAVIAIFVAACSASGGATQAPAVTTIAPVATKAGATAEPATQAANQYTLAGWCTAFKASVEPAWPPKDASTAFTMSQYFRDWATVAELASIQTDMTTVFNWISVASLSTSDVTPPTADVTAAYGRIKDFVASHC
jgi:hypothetical protein